MDNTARIATVLAVLRRTQGHLTYEQARRLLHLSKSHFSRLFCKINGRDFRHERVRVRLEHARELLRTTTASIADIAIAAGYNQRGKFDAAFANEFGITPAQDRVQYRRTQQPN